MNTFFNRLPLPAKLMLIGLVPLALLLYFAAQIHTEKTEKIAVLDAIRIQINKSAAISRVIDELQIERRNGFTYLLLNKAESEMMMLRQKTDSAISNLTQELGTEYNNFKGFSLLDSLPSKRLQVQENRITSREMMQYYSNLIFRMNTLAGFNIDNLPFLEDVSNDLIVQRLLSEMATYLGLLRAEVYYVLINREELINPVAQLRSNYQLYNAFLKEFDIKADPVSKRRFLTMRTMSDLEKTINYLDRLFISSQIDYSVDPETWRLTSAAGVDEIKNLQREILGNAMKKMDLIYTQQQSDKNRNQLFLVLMVALVIVIVFYTMQQISQSLNELRLAAEKISTGASGIQLNLKSKDSIGSLARSIKMIDDSNNRIALTANAIGRGDFEAPVLVRSSDDILGNAIVKMKTNLQEYSRQNEEKLWIQNGLNALTETTRGEKTLSSLASDSLQTMVEYLGGHVGFFYSAQNRNLEFVEGYAIQKMDAVPTHIQFGETLLGQAAQNKKIQVIKDVPGSIDRISSAIGSIEPRYILLIPLVYNSITEGVIEIGSLKPFDETAMKLVDESSIHLAIALHAAKSRLRLQELLEETQAQAEELQTQHSELEHLNTELEEQAHRLQASEEELKVQQEELMQTNQELEERSRLLEERNQLIVERNYEIQKKAEELALTTKYKSEFLANMSHELRTPLNSILLLSRLLFENNEKNLTPDQIEYAGVIQSSGNGLLALIDEILDLSKIEAGKMELEYSSVKPEELAENMRALFQPLAKQKKLEFKIEISQDVPRTIETDKMRLEQVVKNLLSNAFKFTSTGGVRFTIHNVEQNDSLIAFSVEDSGIGIAADKQRLIFEAFQQADGSTRRKYGGTGLGLSISRELVRLLRGEILLDSEPNKGSRFTVHIPRSRVVEHSIPPPASPVMHAHENGVDPIPEQSVKRYTLPKIPENIPDDRDHIAESDKVILIIEDDTGFAKALLDYTHAKGYKGVVAVRGDQGIELAKRLKPLGILLDIQLPVKDGWEVMEELKSDSATRHIPVHIMSSLEVKKESLVKGAIDFINKPVAFEKMNEIFEKLEHVLSREHKKVLIVEENPKHARALGYFLESYQVHSEISGNIQDGVAALNKADVDCVILDMGIPDLKAYEMLENIKKNPGFEKLPIIIFTGKSLSNAEEQRIRQYADSIVIKTAHSYQRILDEVSLFLHLVEKNRLEKTEQPVLRQLGSLTEVLQNKKILITDDDIRNIFSLTKALENIRMNVISAMDGKEALKMIEENQDIDIVLMDIMMPVMDGYETMKRIRQQQRFRRLPIIAVTAKAMTGDREKCIQAGASDYISKPVDMDQLLSLLRVWLYDAK